MEKLESGFQKTKLEQDPDNNLNMNITRLLNLR